MTNNTARPESPAQMAFLNTKLAARFLGLSNRTLEDWRLTGRGPRFRRFGRRVVYSYGDLDGYAASCI
jgi:hypothetical protein